MRIAKFICLNLQKIIPLIGLLFFITSCNQLAIDPEIRIGLVALIAIVSFIVLFTKPILGIYSVLVISIIFNPRIHVSFANLYLHQWIILIALFASISSSLILEDFLPRVESEMNFPIILFIGSILLSLTHAPNLRGSVKWFLYIGVLFASFYVFQLSVAKKKELKAFIKMLILSTFVVCIISLLQGGSGRLGSLVLWNPNAFGNFLALVIPFCTGIIFYGKIAQRKKLLIIFALIPMFVCLILTFSRSSWAGVLAGFIFLTFKKPKISFALVICLIVAISLSVSPVKKRIFEDINDPGAQYRIVKAKIAIQKFKAHPILGNGLGSFHHEAQYSNVWAYRAHSSLENNYLLMLVEGGIIEFAAFLLFAFSFIKMTFRYLKELDNPFIYSVILGSFSSFIAALSAGMFEGTLFNPQFNWLIGMFMACPIIVKKLYKEEFKHQMNFAPLDPMEE